MLKSFTVQVDLSKASLPERKLSSCLYLIEAVGLKQLKIGFTTDIERRFAQLVGENACELKLLSTIPNASKDDEAAAHALFKSQRLHHEWFRDCAEIRSLFNAPSVDTGADVVSPGLAVCS